MGRICRFATDFSFVNIFLNFRKIILPVRYGNPIRSCVYPVFNFLVP